jgi:hypothetical protein
MDEEVVRKELTRAIDACYRNGCSFDMVLKDITPSTNNPQTWSVGTARNGFGTELQIKPINPFPERKSFR